MSDARSLGRYARAVETALGRARRKPVLLSPRDWELVSGWHRQGIPLRLVLETIEEAARRTAAKGSTFASLAYVAREVESAWHDLRAERSAERAEGELPLREREEVLAAWERAASDRLVGEPLAEVLRAVLTRLRAGEAFDADAAIDAALEGGAPEADRAAAAREADSALAAWRHRMSAEAFAATRRRAIIDRLRSALGLPRVSIAR